MTLPERPENPEPEYLDQGMARKSLWEEMEAADLYQERSDAAADTSLKQLFERIMNDEKAHTAMLTEWLKRNNPEREKASEEHD